VTATPVLTRNITTMTAKIDAHAAADLLVRGRYYDADTGKGCFIGCLAHGNDANLILSEYGLPVMLTRVLERIFERLPEAETRAFFLAIPRAIGTDRKDLSRIVWAFLAQILRDLPPQTGDVKAVIDRVIAGMDLLSDGKEWPDAAAYAAYAARAARSAAYAAYAARSAAYAAYAAYARAACAAAYSADAAAYAAYARAARSAATWPSHRDTILRLMTEAPVLETQHA
jgi:hypothetical protein